MTFRSWFSRFWLSRPYSRTIRRVRLRLEGLEERLAPSASTVWNGADDHLTWSDAGNWTNGVPVAGEDVTIPNSGVNGTTKVVYSDPAVATIASLTSSLPIQLTAGTIQTTGGGSVSTGGITLKSGATITITGGASLSIDGGSQTFGGDGSGSIVFGDSNTANAISLDGGVQLTTSFGFTISSQNGAYGTIGPAQFVGPTGTLTNQGFIRALGTNSNLFLNVPTSNNTGLQAMNGGVLTIEANVSGTGSISADPNPASKVVHNGGTISGNSISGEFAPANNSANVLSGVTLAGGGVLDLNPGYENITNGIADGGTIKVRGGSTLAFGVATNESETISGSGHVTFDSSTANSILLNNGVTLTVASGITINGQNGAISGSNGTLVNNGTIQADAGGTVGQGGTIRIAATVTNSGTVQATKGGTLQIDGVISGGTVTTDSGNNSSLLLDSGGGSIANATISGTFAPGGGGVLSGDTVAVSTTATLNGSQVRVSNGLTVNGTLSVQAGANLGFGVNTDEVETVSGSGNILFDSNTSNEISLDDGVALTIAATLTIDGKNGTIGPVFFASPGGTLTNNGTIVADVAGGTIFLDAGQTKNAGTLKGANGAILSIEGPVSGSGTITTDSNANSQVAQVGATVSGNTISGEFVPNGSIGNVLSGVTVGATGVVDLKGGTENISHNLTVNGTINVNGGGRLGFGVAGNETETVSGSGSMIFDTNTSNQIILNNDVTLTVASGIVIDGQNGSITQTSGTLTNNGTIQADKSGGNIRIAADITNTATVQALNGATLTIDATISGGTVSTDSGQSSQILLNNDGTIANATVSGTFGAANAGVLSGDTVAAGTSVNLDGTEVRVSNGLTLNGTINVNNSTYLGFGVAANETEAISGNGDIVFDGSGNASNRISLDNGVALTIGAGVTIGGKNGLIGPTVFAGPNGTLTNQGTIQDDVLGGTIFLDVSPATNTGTLRALNGGVLDIQGSVTGTGTITTDSGHGSKVVQDSATIAGNTIAGEFTPTGSSSNVLSAITVGNTGAVDLSAGYVNITHGLTLNGTIHIRAGSTLAFGVAADETETVSGSGNIVFDSNASNQITLNNGVNLILGANITIDGQNGSITASNGALTNNGAIQDDVGPGNLRITASVTNNSTMQALNGGTLEVAADITGGTITTDSGNGSSIALDSTGSIASATISGLFAGGSGGALSADTIAAGASATFAGASARVTSGLTVNGTVNIQLGTVLGFGTFSNEAETVAGTGSIIFDGNTSNAISLDGGVTLTIAAGITVGGKNGTIGTAQFLAPTGSLINNGIIQDTVLHGTITLNPTSFTNNGTLAVSAGSTLSVQPTAFTNFDSGTGKLTGGTYDIAGTFQFTGANVVTNAANITLDGQAAVIEDTSASNGLANFAANASSGALTLKTGRILLAPGDFSNAGSLVIDASAGASKFTAAGDYTQTGGSTTLVSGGSLASSVNAVSIQGGTLQGTGTITGNVTNGGNVSPGQSSPAAVGLISIAGTYAQTSAGTLSVKFGGAASFDQLAATGNATLDGKISASFFNSYSPSVGTLFANVIDFASVSGDFASRSGFSLGNGVTLLEEFDPSPSPVSLDLLVSQAPIVTTNPVSQTKNAGQSVTFTAAATGSPVPTIQWQQSTDGINFTDLAGQTSTSLTLSNLAPGQNGDLYRAVFTNVAGSTPSTAATLTVQFITITSSPSNQTVNAGQNATFSVADNSNPSPASVQWQVSTDGHTFTNLSGQTSSTLIIAATTADNGNEYQAVLSNSAGLTMTTAPATLTVNFVTITSNPVSVTANAGQSATFTAAAVSNPASPSIQWQISTDGGHSFSNIAGATSLSFSLSNVQPGQNGNEYQAVFTNSAGVSATTTVANLTVNFLTITSDPTNQSATPGNSATFSAAASSLPAPASVQWQVSTDGGHTFNDVSGATSTSYTVQNVQGSQDGSEYQAVFSNSAGLSTTTTPAILTVAAIVITTNPASQTVNAGDSVTLKAAADSSPAATLQWQVSSDGGHTFNDIGGPIAAGSGTLLLSDVEPSQNGNQYQAVFTNASASATTSVALLTVNFVTIAANPVSQTVNAGQPITFTAAANSNPALPGVQWEKSTDGGHTFLNISGATQASLTLATTAVADNGTEYEAVFTNSAGLSATTAPATLTVDYAPTVTTNPTDHTVNAGGTASFTAAANANPAATVQWQVKSAGSPNFVDVPGQNSTTLTLNGITAAQDGSEYQAVFSNSVGSGVTTSAATLTVDFITITGNPGSRTASAGDSVTFTAAADSNPPASVQWQVSSNGGTFTDIPGANGASLIVNATAALNGNQYQAAFSNSAGISVATAPATLTVNFITITTDPSSPTVNAGQTATFTAAASGNPAQLAVQWQVSTNGGPFVNIVGETNATLSVSNTTAVENGNQYQAVFSNGAGISATTTPATLTVDFAPTVSLNPSSQTAAPGQAVNFTAAANANPGASVQWQVSTNGGKTFTNTGTNSTTLTVTAATALNGALYKAAFTNNLGTATTTIASLVVKAGHPIAAQVAANSVSLAYGTALKNTQLSGTATVIMNGQIVNVPGTFTYSTAGTVPHAGTGQTAAVIFAPTDKVHYAVVKTAVVLNVSQVSPQVNVTPIAMTFGRALSNAQLKGTATFTVNGKSVKVAGKYSFVSAAGTVLHAGNGQVEQITFTPTDTTDYLPVSTTVVINVAKATPVFAKPAAAPASVAMGGLVFVSGKITVGPLPVSGFVYISTTPGVTLLQVAINPDGTFAAAVPTTGLARGKNVITYSYLASSDLNAASIQSTFMIH